MSTDRTHSRGPVEQLAPAVLFVALVAIAVIGPSTELFTWIFCPFLALTGIDCPGCGMTRSVTSFVRGDFAAAFHYHAGGPFLVVGLGIFAGVRVADRVRGRKVLTTWRQQFQRWSTPFWGTVLGIVLVYWAVRLIWN